MATIICLECFLGDDVSSAESGSQAFGHAPGSPLGRFLADKPQIISLRRGRYPPSSSCSLTSAKMGMIGRLIISHSPVLGTQRQLAKHFQFSSSMLGVSAR
jgi:hypothetical protein